MKVAFHAGVSSEHQHIDLQISAPLKALRECDSCDDCPGGKVLKKEIGERYWQGYEKRGR
jgi:hypothetical protein